MSRFTTLKRRTLVASLLSAMLLSLAGTGLGNPCQPPTPSPCGADGVCRPIRGTWGYSQTRWRPWPGEPSLKPSPADADSGAQKDGSELGPIELPEPREEDLRGPAKDPKKKANDGDDADNAEAADGGEGGEVAPIEIPEIPALPGADPLPGFDPQGQQQSTPAPVFEDAPPALPPSLRDAALRMQAPQRLARRQPSQRALAMPLVNPASAVFVAPEEESLQQAIYIEDN